MPTPLYTEYQTPSYQGEKASVETEVASKIVPQNVKFPMAK
jgi:hypothetical protein